MQERIVAGDCPIEIEPEYLSIDVGQGPPVSNGGDVVSNCPPEFSIWADMQIVSAMMGVLKLIALHIDSFTRKACGVVLYCQPRKLGMFVQSCVGHIHVPIGGKIRVKREAEQALLTRTISI